MIGRSSSSRKNVEEPENRRVSRRPSRYRVFLSHSSADAEIAASIKVKLEALGAEVWTSPRDKGGDTAVVDMLQKVDVCNEAVLLLPTNFNASSWVLFEAGAFLGQHKRVTPVLNPLETGALAYFLGLRAIPLGEIDELAAEIEREVAEPGTGGKKGVALTLRGSLSPQEAEELRVETRRLRESWR